MPARTPLLALVALLTAGAVLAGAPAAVLAQEGDDTDAALAAPVALPPGVARVAPALAGVVVDGTAARAAQAAFDLVTARRTAAAAARLTAEAELVSLAARDVELTAAIATRTGDRKAAALRVADARRSVQQAAASAYIVSATYDDLARVLDAGSSTQVASGQVLSAAVQEDRAAAEAAARGDLERANDALDGAQRERIDVRDRGVEVDQARQHASVDELESTIELGVRLYELQQARSTARVHGLDFTLVALDAYVAAAATEPDCGIPWWALAGISRVEGRHGTFRGSALEPDGQVTLPIIGIPLTGENGTTAVPDSDGGALDGDPTIDRAVGPMQFIPSTWARWGRDGDGDGDRDPQNLYDATVAAAAYLCAGRTLRDDAGLRAGFFSYNHSEAYVEAVLAHAHAYARFRIPDPPPPPPVPPTIPV